MSDVRVTDFTYAGLAHVFNPPGLRLVEKSEGASPTTSVLVRGAAGTGKTTLSLAIAHAIAKASGGIVVYVASEASLADVLYKAQVLRLGDGTIVDYHSEATLAAGSVAVKHLVADREEALDASPSELSAMLVDRAYELATTRQSDAPVRTVVVDSLELPGAGNDGGVTRSKLAAFTQVLESLGISPIFVEEVGSSTTERLTFVVDVVLQVDLISEPESRSLTRRLAVTKSRYSDAVPGPHDMVMEQGGPAVWPNSPSLDFGGQRPPPGLVLPFLATGKPAAAVSINRGALVLSRYDVDGQKLMRAVAALPGASAATVDCGPVIKVTASQRTVEVPASSGPQALAWALHGQLSTLRANIVIFHRSEHLLAKSRYLDALPELMSRLTRLGYLVCVHGQEAGLKPLDEIADYVGPGRKMHYRVGDERAAFVRRHRSASSWAGGIPGLVPPRTGKPQDLARLKAAKTAAELKIAEGDFAAASAELAVDAPNLDPAVQRQRVEAALLLDQIGQTSAAKARLDLVCQLANTEPTVVCAVAWAYAQIGSEVEALQMAFEGIDAAQPLDEWRRLWHSLWLRYSTVAIDALPVADWSSPIQALLVASACAERGNLSLGASILRLASRVSPQRMSRLLADVRLESKSLADWLAADSLYAALEAEADLAIVDRADIAFNRGVIRERLGEIPAAIELFRRAQSLNPLLEMADERLTVLADDARR